MSIDTLRRMDTTAVKTSTIYGLKRQVDNDTTIVAASQAKYDSFVTKSQEFAELLAQAENELQTAQNNWESFLTLKSNLGALEITANDANLISVVSYDDLEKTIKHWETVVRQTIIAADAINLAAEYITDRKASNPLISNDLLTDITNANNAAAATVTQVINAFTDALTALSVADQAKNSTALSTMYIELARADLLMKMPKGLKPDLSWRAVTDYVVRQMPISSGAKGKMEKEFIPPLEITLKIRLEKEKDKVDAAQAASNQANKEMAIAKEELANATAQLQTDEAALAAAQAAVAG